MSHSVIIWRVISTFTGTAPGSGGPYTFASGNYIHAVLDDATNTLTAKYSSTSADNTGFEITGGPSLFSDPTGAVELITVAPFYQYCEGTTLHQVGTSNGWPYATLSNNLNNSECTIGNVCDLEISSDYTITPTSDVGASDGAIQGTATSSNGLIKFSMDPNFPYGSATPGGTMPALATWTNYNSSSDPITWTPGPVCIVTPPTDPGTVRSDILRTDFSTAWLPGVKYNLQYSFTAVSALSNWRIIYIVAYDEFMNELTYKPEALYGSPAGNSVSGQWELTAPVGMVYLGIYEKFFGQVNGSDELTINSFTEVLTPDAPGVKTELSWAGLPAGTYTVYAKDAAGCQDSMSFVVPVTEDYNEENPRYRLEFKDFLKISSKYHRIDIHMRGYEGETEYVCGGDIPGLIRYEGDANDPSKPLIASNMEIKLMCEENLQFSDIFLSDDRKYWVKHYTDDNPVFSSPEIYWTGYVVPEFYSEPYLAPPYDVTLTVSDQIGEFKNLPFRDEADNKFRGEMSIIKILAAVFKKTDLELPFRCGVNVWSELMNQDDDPLLQAFLDVRIFEDMNCAEVLESIAKSFRGQIFQSQGYWWFIRLSDATGTFNYMEYDKDGNQTGIGTLPSIKEMGGPSMGLSMFSERRQLLTFMRNYGKFTLTNDLVKDGNIIDEGRFEEDDIELQGSGNVGFKRWNVVLGQNGVSYGLERVENGDSLGALFIDFSQVPNNSAQNDTSIYTERLTLENFGGKIRFKFQYMVSPAYKAPYIRIAWVLQLHSPTAGDWWVGQSGAGAWTVFNVETKNNIYVTSYDTWQSFDLLLPWPTFTVWDGVQIGFYCHNHGGRDFADITALKAFVPPESAIDMKVMVRNDPEPESYVYKAEYSYDAESSPDIVRPDTYDEGDADHRILWRRESIFGPIASGTGLVSRIKFDNVSFAIYPAEPTNAQIIDPPENLIYSQTEDTSNKSAFSDDVLIGDMLRIDPETDHYRNERYIYRSFIRLSDGTPTQYWHRLGVLEEKRLLQITLEDYVAQFKTPQRKLSGALISSQIIHFINSFRDNASATLERYRPMTFEFDLKNAQYVIDMNAVNGGPDGEPPLVLGAYDHNFDDAYDGGIDNGEMTIGSFGSEFSEDFE